MMSGRALIAAIEASCMTNGGVDAWGMIDTLKSLVALDGDQEEHVATVGAEMNEVLVTGTIAAAGQQQRVVHGMPMPAHRRIRFRSLIAQFNCGRRRRSNSHWSRSGQ